MPAPMHTEFARPDGQPALGEDDIHVWLLVLDGTPNPREVTAAAHRALRRLLIGYAALDREPDIERSERGKPYAPALAGIDFNLSHARDHVLLAFARHQPLGVDLERIDRRLALEDLARRFFSAAEADALDALPAAERLPAFLRLWTCKEAVLKAIGEGISFGLDRVVFALGGDGVPAKLARIAAEAGPVEDWQVSLLEPASGFVGAVAWRGPQRQVRPFVFGPDV